LTEEDSNSLHWLTVKKSSEDSQPTEGKGKGIEVWGRDRSWQKKGAGIAAFE